MIFHENRLLADDSHEISFLKQTILMKYHSLFFQKLRKMSQNLLSAAVVIGALIVNINVLDVVTLLTYSFEKVLLYYALYNFFRMSIALTWTKRKGLEDDVSQHPSILCYG